MHRPGRSISSALLAAAIFAAGGCRRAAPARGAVDTASALRGHALLTATRDSLPRHVGNGLRCTSCHLHDGRDPRALSWVGVTARYPQLRARSDAVSTIEDRVNDCFERSMNGSALPVHSRDMRDIVAYLQSLSDGNHVAGAADVAMPVSQLVPDTARGARLYAATCAGCHGDRGQGTASAPALWGAGSYNVGAGMARLRTAAAFIRYNMPYGAPTLTDQEAVDVAAYVDSRPRPDFAGKENDWPRGDAPADVPYATHALRRSADAATH